MIAPRRRLMMKTMLRCLALAAFTIPMVPVVSAHPLEDDVAKEALSDLSVRWKSRNYKGTALPEGLGEGPPAAIEAWAPWTVEHKYQMNLTDDARVLLISPQRNGKLSRQMELINETQRLFDKLVPEPKREPLPKPGKDAEPKKPTGGEVPEDPEGGPVGWSPDDEEPLPFTYSYEWGAGTWPVDTETCVLIVVHDEEDYGTLVDQLGEMQEYLKPWAKTGKKFTGFVHERPLVAAYIENATGQEEWDPDNEVVHRVAQMMFVRRFSSQQPYWLVQGFSWYIENKIRKAIYCFPYRDEFVWATEHTGWDNELKNRFNDRKSEPLRPEEFASWKRGKYDGDVAKVAYGLVGFIAKHHAKGFSQFIEDMRLFANEDNKVDLGRGSWERDPDYTISADDQMRFATEHFGDEFLEKATAYFRKGGK